MKFLSSSKFRISLFIIICTVGIFYLLFNDKGLLRFIELRSEVNDLKDKIEQLDVKNKSLESEIDSLKRKIPSKIERTAREKYDMLRPNEKKIEFIEEE